MTQASLRDVLPPALTGGYAVAGFVVQGWEDARAFVTAAEVENQAIILQAGPGCRRHTPLAIIARMFEELQSATRVPVVSHLDHAFSVDECKEALDLGFTSVMIDGSKLSLSENIALTNKTSVLARQYSASIEAEIGVVGYADGECSEDSNINDIGSFLAETDIDALAVSIGNVHLQQTAQAQIDMAKLREIESLSDTPLVLHGGSGIPHVMRRQLATTSKVCKFNIGTEVRLAFGALLRDTLERDKDVFDRIEILGGVEQRLVSTARKIIRNISA